MAFSTDNIGKNCYINMSEDENVEDSLYGTIIGYYKDTDKNEEYYFVSINGNVKRIYDDSLVNIVDDGGGGSVTPGTLIMVSGEMTEEQATQFRENIGAISIDDIGTVFVLKGSVDTVGDLPVSGNSVGDVYYVKEDSVGYIWLISDSHPNGYWEELGKAFDITVDSELSTTSENPVQNKVISLALAEKGTYSKPSGGIPKFDLANDVQTSLGKADTALQSAPVTSVNGKTGIVDLNADDIGALPNDTPIPPTVTEQTVSGWGFTKNTGTYSKPSGGIPKSDLASTVQTSLEKADTALQSVPPEYATENWVTNKGYGTYSKPASGIPKSDLASAVQTSLGKADIALQSVPNTYRTAAAQDLIDEAQDARINQKADASALAKVATTGSYNDLSNKPTIPTVPTDEISANTAARHTHSNKSVLDEISSSDISTWNGKQDTISDLSTIRSGASAGATAVQPSAISDMATKTWVGQQGYLTQHQDISGKLDINQGTANAGKFMVVGSNGNITAVTMQTWQGGSY